MIMYCEVYVNFVFLDSEKTKTQQLLNRQMLSLLENHSVSAFFSVFIFLLLSNYGPDGTYFAYRLRL